MKTSLLSALVLAMAASPSLATLTFYDPFDYAGDGSSLSDQIDTHVTPNQQWFRAGSGTNDPKTTTGNLSYPGLAAPVGNSVLLNNASSGQTLSRVDIQPYVGPAAGDPAVNLYYSMVLHVTDLSSAWGNTGNGSFLAGLQYYYPEATNPANDGMTASPSSGAGILAIHAANAEGTAFNLGIAHRDAAPGGVATRVFDTTPYTADDTLFVVVKYVIGSGNKDDAAYLYIDPASSSFGGTEPTSYTVASLSADISAGYDYFYNNTTGVQLVDSGGVTVNSLRSFFLRNNSVEPAGIQIDDVRVGTTWADVTPAGAPVHNAGDTNNDGVVDLTDLNNVLNNFGSTGAGNPGDDDSSGNVDLTDLNNVLNNFGTTYAAAALNVVPEPASLSLLAIGATSLLARRRRRRSSSSL